MMDRDYLAVVKHRTPLVQALGKYHVRYYVRLRLWEAPRCSALVEPSQAGPASPVMLGTVCAAPVATFTHGALSANVFNVSEVQ